METSRVIENPTQIRDTREQPHNSTVPINRVIPDILYHIFVLAVYESPTPMKTAFIISHVCRHWREFALECQALWKFIDLDFTPSMISSLISRSGNVPLILSWAHNSVDSNEPEKVYRGSIADLKRALPRLCSLTLHLRHSELDRISRVLRDPNVLPLKVRHLDVHLGPFWQRRSSSIKKFMRIDPSSLRVLKLEIVDLPWIHLPHKKLTRFEFKCPVNPPALSHLLTFLSGCPLLSELKLCFIYIKTHKVDITNATTRSITELNFPQLKRLVLQSFDVSSYAYLRQITSRIRIGTLLSQCCLWYDNRQDGNGRFGLDKTTLNIFDTVPSGILPKFTGHRFLRVQISLIGWPSFSISSGFNYNDRSGWSTESDPLEIVGSFPFIGSIPFRNPQIPGSFDSLAPMLDLIRIMSEITYLEISSFAWQLPWIADIPRLFPCLDTIRLYAWESDVNLVLNSLPAGLKLRKFIFENSSISSIYSIDLLLDVVVNSGAEIFEFRTGHIEETQAETIKTTLRQRGVVVVQH